ncbi:hypothetical protein PR048_021996 [Dryococelus australis]|uniref:Uncharacterized protein n=1 Tax=Dryococelus australis TaxID=614101 RepID=A0ABQ9GZU5_9NEOP|nr:hypothetical protein PR048_021996 [Dryococelus australis]
MPPKKSNCQHTKQLSKKLLLIILSSLKYFARQGLGVRSHLNNEGNSIELLKLRSLDVPHKADFLRQNRWKMMHPEIQNEVLEIFGQK